MVGRRSIAQPSNSGLNRRSASPAYSSVPNASSSTKARCSLSAFSPTISATASRGSRSPITTEYRTCRACSRANAARTHREFTSPFERMRARKEFDVVSAFAKCGRPQDLETELDRRMDTFYQRLAQRAFHASDRDVTTLAESDDLGDHRIVVRRNSGAGIKMGIHPYARASGKDELRNLPRCGRKVISRILRVDTALDCVAAPDEVRLCVSKRLARCDANLLLHQIDVVNHLGHRMLDLNASVHFHEVRVVAVHEELERSGIRIPHVSRCPQSHLVQRSTNIRAKVRRRGLFDQLLMGRLLDRTVAFAEMHHAAELVAEYLHFDMPRLADESLQIDSAVFEARFSLGGCARIRSRQLARPLRRRASRGRRRPRSP